VESQGSYPVNSNTLVADVCRYQNDGTNKITPSKFIERAEAASNGWGIEMSKAQENFIDGDGDDSLQIVADLIADDISVACDRVKTGRLKRSFKGLIHGRN